MNQLIEKLKIIALRINGENSGLYPGIFKDAGTFEAIISKKPYYDSDLEFIIGMYISLQKCHVFHDGNKRTSLGLFELLLSSINFYILDEIKLVDFQVLYIENKITKEEFIIMINKLIEKE